MCLASKAPGSRREDVELFVAEQKPVGFKDTEVSQHQTVDDQRKAASWDDEFLASLIPS